MADARGWLRPPLGELPAYGALREHAATIAGRTLERLFAADAGRAQALSAEACGLYLDLSKQRITPQTLDLLLTLAQQAGLRERIEAMFAAEPINVSEGRPVLHVALRAPRGECIEVAGADVVEPVHEVLDRMGAFAEEVRGGSWRGVNGEQIRAVVNIGIGGSHLGPRDGGHGAVRIRPAGPDLSLRLERRRQRLWQATTDLDPASTLFVVVSKTFGTLETLENARAAREWVTAALGEDAVARHFVAVSTSEQRVRDFGIETRNMFGFWDWVGGRYSLPSAVGLQLMLAIGPERFRELLAGMRAIDEHLRDAPARECLPVLLGLAGFWNATLLGHPTVAVLPYCDGVERAGLDQRLGEAERHRRVVGPCAGGQRERAAADHVLDRLEGAGRLELDRRADRVAHGQAHQRSPEAIATHHSVSIACEHTFVSILHADADCFFASVEQRDQPRLRGRPTMVATWVVMAASYEARAFGIHSAMHATEARRLCPDVVAVEPRSEAYAEASAALFSVFEAASPTVEPHGMEEAFLDGSAVARRAAAGGRPARGRPADHRRRREHEDRGEDGQPRGQAGRAADRRRRARVPARPPRRAAVGHRQGDRGAAARARHRDGRRGRRAGGAGADRPARHRQRPPRARARQQPRPRAGPRRPPAPRVRLVALARARRPPAGRALAVRRAGGGAITRGRASPAERSRCTCASPTTRPPPARARFRPRSTTRP